MRIKIIKSSDKINEILKKGTKINSGSFVLFYLPLPAEEGALQFAAIAGKRTFKRAVDRNFVKRRIRHLVRYFCCRLRRRSGTQILMYIEYTPVFCSVCSFHPAARSEFPKRSIEISNLIPNNGLA
ncbi:MAG: Ribonuclease [Candidatus Midichloriaceae bacterium]|nr:Ribonuclease [Candidatus Midichloriaceae bacterium]